MLNSLRGQLTNWFVGLFVVLYCGGSIFALLVFDSVLTSQLDEDCHQLSSEIRPSIDFKSHQPTLKTWAEHLFRQQKGLLATIQLFDNQGMLLESYGPAGVPTLATGTLSLPAGKNITVRSSFKKLEEVDQSNGFLQVQVSTSKRDEALHQFGLTLLILAPFFALAVWLAGYFFSEKAVQPVGQTLDLLRRFVADAGHEFNTPITVIEASVQTLEEMFKEKDMPPDVLDVITRASARMRDLAASLMLLARMENPELVTKRVPLDLTESLEPLVAEFRQIGKGKGIAITWQAPPKAQVLGHEDSLRTMVSNLLDNALRYTEPGGTVSFNIQAQEATVTLTVEDDGIGIPPESVNHIFERFYRVDKSRSRAAGGSGLGLSIVKAIVDAHKGVIKVESSLSHGTKFVVVLPAR